MANWALSVMSFGCTTISTLIFSSIESVSMGTCSTVKSAFNSVTTTQGSCRCIPIRAIIGLDWVPKIGSGLITPTTGLLVLITCVMARAKSYSSSFSRSRDRNGSAKFLERVLDVWQVGLVLGRGAVRIRGDVEADFDRRFEPSQDFSGAGREGVDLVAGRIPADAHLAEDEVEAKDDEEGQDDAGGGIHPELELGVFHGWKSLLFIRGEAD